MPIGDDGRCPPRRRQRAPIDILYEYSMGISVTAISLKLPEALLEASGRYADALRLTRAEYIRRALEQMNRETRAHLRARRLRAASRNVRGERCGSTWNSPRSNGTSMRKRAEI